jgi:hypothetical protein
MHSGCSNALYHTGMLTKWRRARKITYSNFTGKSLYSGAEMIELIEKKKRAGK